MAYSSCLKGAKLGYTGSANSDFQAQPVCLDTHGNIKVTSDWEYELVRNLEGKDGIKYPQDPMTFPSFHTKAPLYFKRSKEINETMFRISLDLPRLSSERGQFNEPLMAQYVYQLALAIQNGLEPMLTLYHWPMPYCLLDIEKDTGNILRGAWEHDDALDYFKDVITHVIRFLADRDKLDKLLRCQGIKPAVREKIYAEGLVRYIITINEPSTFNLNGYLAGEFLPYKKLSFLRFRRVIKKLAQAHRIAYKLIKEKLPDVQVGVAYNWTYFDGWIGKLVQRFFNEWLTKQFEGDGSHSDFLALQYYCRVTLPSGILYPPLGPIRPKNRYYGDHPGFGDMYPSGIRILLKRLHKLYPSKPLWITEFGAVDKRDIKRPYIIFETVREALKAQAEGVLLKGMLIWTLVENYEWEQGMNGKCGLFIEADLEKQLRPSAKGVRSWEVWQAINIALQTQTEESFKAADYLYDLAKQQFVQANQ